VLQPENILMVSENDDTNIMLCDFGFAKHIIDLQGDRTLCGTPDYVAPEILMRQPYGASVDIWSAGIITYTLLGGYPPFYDDSDNHNKLFRKIIKGNFVFDAPFWDPVSAEAKDLIQQMLTLEPSKRPSAADLLHHPWVADASNPTKKGASEADLTGAVERLKKWQAKRRLQGAMKTVRAVTRLQNATHSPEEEGETEEEEEESETSVSPLKNTTTSISVEESPVKEESVPAKVEAPVSTTNEEPEEEVVDDVDTIESSVSSEPPPPAPPLQGAQVTAFVSPVSAPRSPKKIPKKRFLGVTSRVRRTSESIERPIDKGTGGIQPERHEEEVKMSSGTDLEESVDASVHDSKDEGELKEEEGASDDDVDSDIAFDDVIALPAPAQKERRSLLSKLVGTGYLKLTAEQRQQQKLESKERKKTEAARKKVHVPFMTVFVNTFAAYC
jgi:serine/threonine protein kinase